MSRGARTLLVLIVALVAAGASSWVVYRAVSQIPVREVEIRGQPVVVAARQLPVGTAITVKDVKLVEWPARSVVPGSLQALEAAVGRGLIQPALENEPITEAKLAPREAGVGIAPTIPEGMRAISVKVDEVIGVAGFVFPGSQVDVLVTVSGQSETRTRTVVSNLRVLAAGPRTDQQEATDGKAVVTTTVTLLATPPDAEKIALASSAGRVMLALRNPLDTEPTDTPGIHLAALTGPPAPPPVVRTVQGRTVAKPVAPPAPPPPKLYTVEAIKAAKRTEEVIK